MNEPSARLLGCFSRTAAEPSLWRAADPVDHLDVKRVDLAKSSPECLHHCFLRCPARRETLWTPLGVSLLAFGPTCIEERRSARYQEFFEHPNVDEINTDPGHAC